MSVREKTHIQKKRVRNRRKLSQNQNEKEEPLNIRAPIESQTHS
jgi:hypothetical protein